MKYRSVVPLATAPDVEKPILRVRLHRLSHEARLLADHLGLWDGDTMDDVRKRVENMMAKLNDDQRRQLLVNIAKLFA